MPERSAAGAVLTVGGVRHTGWTSIRVQRSLGQVAGIFDLGVTEKYPGAQGQYQFRLGSPCTVSLDGQTVITGYVEDIAPSYDANNHTITVRGRDRTGDLVDCGHPGPPTQWRDVTLAELANMLCQPFGVTVRAEVDTGEKLASVAVNPGESVLSVLAKLARQRGVLLVSYGDGALVITRSQARASGGSLELGGNVKAARGTFSNGGRFSRYLVRGQGVAMPWEGLQEEQREEFQSLYRASQGEAFDPAISRYRPVVILASSAANLAEMEEQARWEATTRAGRARAATYTVAGWGPDAGGLWQINTTVPVSDDFLGLHETMLIENVAYSLDASGGSTTELGVVHPDAYLLRPEPEAAGGITGIFDETS